MKNIYLAGPDVFLPDPQAWFAIKKEICKKYGFIGHAPLDNTLNPDAYDSPFAFGIALYLQNKHMMDSCDMVVANMTPYHGISMDVGTAFEMGYMAAQGKPVYGYSNDPTAFIERQKNTYAHFENNSEVRANDTQMMFEDMNMCDNLMMVGAMYTSTHTTPITATTKNPHPTDIYKGTDAFKRTLHRIRQHMDTHVQRIG